MEANSTLSSPSCFRSSFITAVVILTSTDENNANFTCIHQTRTSYVGLYLLYPTGLSYKPEFVQLFQPGCISLPHVHSCFPLPPPPKPHFHPAGCILPSSASSAYILTELTGTETFLLVPLTGFRPCCCVTHSSVLMFFFKHVP